VREAHSFGATQVGIIPLPRVRWRPVSALRMKSARSLQPVNATLASIERIASADGTLLIDSFVTRDVVMQLLSPPES